MTSFSLPNWLVLLRNLKYDSKSCNLPSVKLDIYVIFYVIPFLLRYFYVGLTIFINTVYKIGIFYKLVHNFVNYTSRLTPYKIDCLLCCFNIYNTNKITSLNRCWNCSEVCLPLTAIAFWSEPHVECPKFQAVYSKRSKNPEGAMLPESISASLQKQ